MLHDYTFESADIAIVLTLVLLEGVLSLDNAAILAAMVRKLPVEKRQKALLYGLGGAYVFRITAILLVSVIIANPVLKLVGGLYLLYLAVRHLGSTKSAEAHEFGFLNRMGVSAFWSVIIAIELADIAFALDQVLVAVAMTEKLLLIVIASMSAILMLRFSAVYMARLMDWFPRLEMFAYLAVGLVGLKLVVEDVVHRLGYPQFDIPKEITVSVTFALIVLPVVVKFLMERTRRRPRPEA